MRLLSRTGLFSSPSSRSFSPHFCEIGWPTNTEALNDSDLIHFTRRRDELSLQDGCILWGSRVVVPPKLRSKLLEELHMGHAGASRMKELARSYVW